MKSSGMLPSSSESHTWCGELLSSDGELVQHGEWLEKVVALEVLAWLDTSQGTAESQMGLQVHRAIVKACRQFKHVRTASEPGEKGASYRELGKFRRQIILAINAVSEELPRLALDALNGARNADVRYRVEGPFGEDHGLITVSDFALDDVVFGNPSMALEAMVALRGHAPTVQCQALELLSAKSDARLSASSAFRDAVPKKIRDAWLRRSTKKLAHSTSSTDVNVQELVDAVWHGFQCASGTTPIAAAVPSDASDALLVHAAKGYQDLRWVFKADFVQEPLGVAGEKRQAEASWVAYRACGIACGVVATWLLALSADPSTELCEFCYRHRETRRRCRVHTSPDSATPEARLGKILCDSFARRVMTLGKDPSIKKVLKASLVADALDLRPMLLQADAMGLSGHLRYSAAVLATQLRVLRPLLSANQAIQAAELFDDILSAAKDPHSARVAQNLAEDEKLRERRNKLTSLFSLSGFLQLWWGNGASGDLAVFKIKGRGFDPGHPLLITGAHDLSVGHAFLRQRAWIEVSENFEKRTTIDRDRALELRADGASLRRIGEELGCSHTKVWLLLQEGGPQKKRRRAVLKPYRR